MTTTSPAWDAQGLIYSSIQELRSKGTVVPDALTLGFRSISLRPADLASPRLLGERFSVQTAWQTYRHREFEKLWALYAGLPAGAISAMTARDRTLGVLAGIRCRHVPVADVLGTMLRPGDATAWEPVLAALFDPQANASAGWSGEDWRERLRALYGALVSLEDDPAWSERSHDLAMLVDRLLLRAASYYECALNLRQESLTCLKLVAKRQCGRAPFQPDPKLAEAIARLSDAPAPAPDDLVQIRQLQADIEGLQAQRADMLARLADLQAELDADRTPSDTVDTAAVVAEQALVLEELRAQVETLTACVVDLDQRAGLRQAELAQQPEAARVVEADRQHADRLQQIEAALAGFADDWRRVATFFEPGSQAGIPADLRAFPLEARQAFGAWQDFHKLEGGWTLPEFADPAKSFTAWRSVLESLLERILVQPFMVQADPDLFREVPGRCPLTARYLDPANKTLGLGTLAPILRHADRPKGPRQRAFVTFLKGRPALAKCLEPDFSQAFRGLLDYKLNGLAHKPALALEVFPQLYPLCMTNLFGDFDRTRFSLVSTLLQAYGEEGHHG